MKAVLIERCGRHCLSHVVILDAWLDRFAEPSNELRAEPSTTPPPVEVS